MAADAVDVILRDGRTLRLRPPLAADADALLEFFTALSPESLHARFHGLPRVGPQLVEPLLEPDWTERGVLLGTLAAEDGGLSASWRSATTCGCGARRSRRRRLRWRTSTRAVGSARGCSSSCRARGCGRDRAVRRRGAARQPSHAGCLREGRVRADARARGRGGGGAVPDRADGALRGARRRAGPPRRRLLAAAVLRACERGRDRSVSAARLDRRRAVPQRARGRLRRRRVPREPRR